MLFCSLETTNSGKNNRRKSYTTVAVKTSHIERKHPKSPRKHTFRRGFGCFCVSGANEYVIISKNLVGSSPHQNFALASFLLPLYIIDKPVSKVKMKQVCLFLYPKLMILRRRWLLKIIFYIVTTVNPPLKHKNN